ncbi:hypothetical protein DMC25_07775 [Caulobacter sp. D4A]|uniref:hypothetical protein n=1 Tax=unclassified Caulobacter TaxID=2648921 RepID=UPI000D72F1CF|nr:MULTISPECIES: hypothetical protein [unclassified Caulobacter]PXA90459.1 hypothetical protein DMC25_07775 [Caulobacter sp. D4A]PXA96936.1 hypothetical protein DMC18_00075 [Caulobacter sp. D5]
MLSRRHVLAGASALAFAGPARAAAAAPTALEIATPMAAPEWALLQRELLKTNEEACEAFFARYFDDRGYLLAYERWGANDGPDDAIENVNDWPTLHALGAGDRVLDLAQKAFEGNVRQYTAARTKDVPFAREGMYYKEFPVMSDWQHLSEGLSVFNLLGLSAPNDPRFRERARRFSGFYTGEDPTTPNYDPKLNIIRSMITGSRGPMLRQATPLDWAGDPFDVTHFYMEHGERSYEETMRHYDEYGDVVGDSPLNLQATSLVMNAYMLDHEPRYRDWILTYVDGWIARARANGDVIPSKVGLDGRIGGPKGQWWSGVYGWGFSPVVPQTGKREDRNRTPRAVVGFMNAYLLTGDDKYLDVWRRQTDVINAQKKVVDGKVSTPRMHGPKGWYAYAPGEHQLNGLEIWYLSMKGSDRARAAAHPWLDWLDGKDPSFPAKTLRADLERVRARAQARRDDTSTPDTRLADATLDINPASVTALIHLMEGGIHIARPPWSKTSPAQGGALHYVRLRYFDPDRRRAGVPEDVAALVEKLTDDETVVTLVNLNQVAGRRVTVQGGAYGEHQIVSAAVGDVAAAPIDASAFTVRLAPGGGARLTLKMRRHVNPPTLSFPWDRKA